MTAENHTQSTLHAALLNRSPAGHERLLDGPRLESDAPGFADLAASVQDLLNSDPVSSLYAQIVEGSPYLATLIRRDPQRFHRILTEPAERHFESLLREVEQVERLAAPDIAGLKAVADTARQMKAEGALLIACADIIDAWSLDTITGALTDLADTSLRCAVRHLFRQAVARGEWKPDTADADAPDVASGYFILAMGKHGARELNYSSDVDLVVLYDRRKHRLADPDRLQRFFVRMTQDLVRFMTDRTPAGYVYRTDLRLRPDPGATQVALSTDAASHYYESFGQNWERAAFIKARAVAGDIDAGRAFLQGLAPFVWRKYLDYAAIADIHAMKRQIHAHKGFSEIAVAGHNIKLGRGGIREIEFFVQTQQLIAGGRQPELRGRRTLEMMGALCERGWVTGSACSELEAAYRFLRQTEHRLQMVNDEQTQTLPVGDDALDTFARFAGFADRAAFGDALKRHLANVQKHYGELFEHSLALTANDANLVLAGEDDDPETVTALAAMGFDNPTKAIGIVRTWHRGRYRATASAQARQRLTDLQPTLLKALGGTLDPDAALVAFDRLLSQLPAGVQLFAMLAANPKLLDLIASIMGTAPRLARILARRRRIIDAVVDPLVICDGLPSRKDLEIAVRGELASAQRYEDVLDVARVVAAEQSFLIGLGILSGSASSRQAADAYADLSEILISELQIYVTREFERTHGVIPGGRWCVVAMGKLGGREMTAASDLDLIVIYDVEAGAKESDGPRPLAVSQYYARLTQRLIAALSAPTAEGRLFEVDLRLRPSGQKGPVATRFSAFRTYQRDQAWTWEHMALTRARVVSGQEAMRTDVQGEISTILRERRAPKTVLKAVAEMRDLIHREKGTDDIWDLKHVRGGLVDVEFIAQALQLIHGADVPDCLHQQTRVALSRLDQNGLLPGFGADLLNACDLYNELTQILRLCFDGPFAADRAPDGLKHLISRAVALPTFDRVESVLRETQGRVREIFDAVIVTPAA